ncbi:hypothetical protein NDU88_000049 [Pleurodeles waltl]|uniref:Uncharacterized protein n=1 Tax=Pleurodeles waltl TaxID=8319 RepID=A0AAV7SVG7_PLEWA|nr:hypothetical protein NDU88_000049 [Pleurodeles waltl]
MLPEAQASLQKPRPGRGSAARAGSARAGGSPRAPPRPAPATVAPGSGAHRAVPQPAGEPRQRGLPDSPGEEGVTDAYRPRVSRVFSISVKSMEEMSRPLWEEVSLCCDHHQDPQENGEERGFTSVPDMARRNP